MIINSNVEPAVTVFCSFSNRELTDIESWLLPSLMLQKNIAMIDLYLVNYTGRDANIYAGPSRRGIVSITELNPKHPCGFGEAHNFAFKSINPAPYFLVVNPDVYLHELCLRELLDRISGEDGAGLVEARQLPYENPKEYDPVTGETPWATGCCLMVNSMFFREAGGFDELFWMYTEDVDLSWRAWLAGYRVVYHPPAVAYHYTDYYFSYNSYRFYTEDFWSARNFLYILYKYWGSRGVRRGKWIIRGLDYPVWYKNSVIASFVKLKRSVPSRSFRGYRRRVGKHRDRIMVVGFNQYNIQTAGQDV